jgi:uncharacterized ferritin-like protein (DUF455 family)
VRDLRQPGRSERLCLVTRAAKSPKPEALRDPFQRAKLIHSFLHHEVQAAELCCWALLRFADAESAFRQGLIRIVLDETRHARMYAEHLERLGHSYGDFPVRDWFWERIPCCTTKLQFAALMGLGLEAANLEHASRFATLFSAAGDVEGAELQERIGREEIGHVRFGRYWLECWLGGPVSFHGWKELLPAPLSPLLMRGTPLNVEARKRAGINDQFIQELAAWRPENSGS